MAKKQLKMIYALKDGEIVSIDDVEKGLKCNCVCPACGEPLVAKKGEHMMKHFAHHSGHSCEYGYETSLHLAAKDILLNNSSEKTWKYNSVCQKYLNAFYAASDKRYKISRGFATHIDDCPIKQRMYHGKPYANFIDDCLCCDYCISYEEEETMLCSGRTRIATIADFKVPEEKRIKDSDNILSDIREQAVYCGHCPYCGHDLVKRNGPRGAFFGCRNYPHCQFTTPCNEETGTPIY